jgi:hypothetical protein
LQRVAALGGYDKSTRNKRWCAIAKQLGFKDRSGFSLKQHYERWILPFNRSMRDDELKTEEDVVEDEKPDIVCFVIVHT